MIVIKLLITTNNYYSTSLLPPPPPPPLQPPRPCSSQLSGFSCSRPTRGLSAGHYRDVFIIYHAVIHPGLSLYIELQNSPLGNLLPTVVRPSIAVSQVLLRLHLSPSPHLPL